MALMNIAPTRSNLLALSRQLDFAEEGYDLLEQKRQLLVLEIMARLPMLQAARTRRDAAIRLLHDTIRAATLTAGALTLDHAAHAVRADHEVAVTEQHQLGLRLPRASVQMAPLGPHFGTLDTPAQADEVLRQVAVVLPIVAEHAALETSVLRLAAELRKTQRRVNALSKIFIPNHRDTIAYIRSTLEERERETLAVLKTVRRNLGRA